MASFERAESKQVLDLLLDDAFSVPTHLRPCCAFGHDLELDLSELPVPLVVLSNVIDPENLGHHSYDGGYLSTSHGIEHGFLSREENGLVYTCRGGFIDIAHVRDYADWTVFLARRLRATLAKGVALELPEEGARRFVFVAASDRDRLERVGASALAAQLAQWITYQLSLWHETATWYGWAAVELFPERASAFSPEDMYSNLLGTHLASTLVQAGIAEDEEEYALGMDRALPEILDLLGAVPPETTRLALDAVDGLWWDSTARLPDEGVVLRRNISPGPEVVPWLIPGPLIGGRLAADLTSHCGDTNPAPVVLRIPETVEGTRFEDIARVDLRVNEPIRTALRWPDSKSPWLSQRDFPDLMRRISGECEDRFGAGHDRPFGAGQ